MCRLSIIVPVYNVEKYLQKCLNNLLLQDIPKEEYEIIVVNDGSTDNSSAIADKYVAGNQNIHLIIQENQGLGGARNTGIKHANGNYIMFVDSDDYIEEKCLSALLKRVEDNNLEILRYNHEEVNEDYNIIPKRRNAKHAVIFDEEISSGAEYLSEKMGYACYVCVYLFKTSLIKEGNFYFEKGIYFEDVEWLPKVMMKAKRVKTINKQVYYYLKRKGSITQAHDIEKKKKLLNDKFLMLNHLRELITSANDQRVAKWASGLSALIVVGILSYIEINFRNQKAELICRIKQNTSYPLSTHKFTFKQKILVFMININPALFCRYIRFRHHISK